MPKRLAINLEYLYTRQCLAELALTEIGHELHDFRQVSLPGMISNSFMKRTGLKK